MVTGIAALVTSLAGLITAVTGLVGMVLVARRTSPRERGDAAQEATHRALNPPVSAPDAQREALVELHQARKRRRPRRGR